MDSEPPPAQASPAPIAVAIRTFGLIAIAIGAIWLLSDIFLLLFAAVLIAIGLRALGRLASKPTGLPRGVLATILFLMLIMLFIAAGFIWGSRLVEQSDQTIRQVQAAYASVRDTLDRTIWGKVFSDYLSGLHLFGTREQVAGKIASVASSTFGVAGSLLIVLGAAAYLAADPAPYVSGLIRLAPPSYRSRFQDILVETQSVLERWMLGRLVDMMFVIAMTYAGLLVLGLPAALPLAIVAGLLNFVPYIGALVGAVPAVLVAFVQSPETALWTAGLFSLVQMLEGYLLSPLIQERAGALPPALTILSQTLFGALFGILGIVLAPAITAAMLVLVRMAYVEDALEGGAGRALATTKPDENLGGEQVLRIQPGANNP